MSHCDPDFADSKQLLRLTEPGATADRIWGEEALGQMLGHQLAAPICIDLQHLDNVRALRAAQLCDTVNPPIRSFADLFAHASPPLELLRLVKAFAQAQLHAPEPSLPRPIALVLYDSAILAARARLNERITDLPDKMLRESARWLAGQPWMDASIGRFVHDASMALIDE